MTQNIMISNKTDHHFWRKIYTVHIAIRHSEYVLQST